METKRSLDVGVPTARHQRNTIVCNHGYHMLDIDILFIYLLTISIFLATPNQSQHSAPPVRHSIRDSFRMLTRLLAGLSSASSNSRMDRVHTLSLPAQRLSEKTNTYPRWAHILNEQLRNVTLDQFMPVLFITDTDKKP